MGTIVHLKRGKRDSLLKHRLLKCFCGRVCLRLQYQLHIWITIRRNHREPAEFPNRNVLGLLEAQDNGIEREGSCLVLDHDAAEFDFHSLTLAASFTGCLLENCSFSEMPA